MKNWINKYFTEEDLKSIQQKISETEETTSGELRVCFRHKRQSSEKTMEKHSIALDAFHSLGMHKTKHKTGVLIFILFDEKYFDVIADEGIHKKIPDEKWKEIELKITEEFKKGNFSGTIIHVLTEIGKVLAKEFPNEADDTNELTDEISIR